LHAPSKVSEHGRASLSKIDHKAQYALRML